MYGLYFIAYVENIITGKTSLDYKNLFSRNNNKKIGKIVYKYFKDKYNKRNVNFDLRLKNIYILVEIKHNSLMNEKH